MAYLFRRLQSVSQISQFFAGSATIGDPHGFLKELTGVEYELISIDDDGAGTPKKNVMLCRIPIRRTHVFRNELIKEYATTNNTYGRFLLFVDSDSSFTYWIQWQKAERTASKFIREDML